MTGTVRQGGLGADPDARQGSHAMANAARPRLAGGPSVALGLVDGALRVDDARGDCPAAAGSLPYPDIASRRLSSLCVVICPPDATFSYRRLDPWIATPLADKMS
jgi:hypothetical protein